MKIGFLLALLLVVPLSAAEKASYDSAGGLTAVIDHGAELPLHGALFVEFTGGLTLTAQPHEQRSPVTRDDHALSWKGTATFPNLGRTAFDAAWTESADGVKLQANLNAETMLDLQTVDYVIDLPRDIFVGGQLGEKGANFPDHKPADPVFYRENTASVTFTSAKKDWHLALTLDQPRPVTVRDHWDKSGRFYRVRISLRQGFWSPNQPVHFELTLKTEANPHAAAAQLSVTPADHLYSFDGFGGDYCFGVQTPVVEYTMDNLPSAWTRLEFKATAWDRERATKPGPQLLRDFELMQRVQKSGIPWVLSLWRLPERFYTDPNEKPMGTFGRQIAADRWPEFLELLGTYLQYLKQNYGAEPTLFSFNEPDLGVDIGFTGETHRDAIKRIGGYLASQGLKTKILLGDTANPRDTYLYTLPTASDPEAMRYVGAVSFHSWGNGTPQQYRDWGAVGKWLQLPLIVGEAGVDPGSYRNFVYDSYGYGLRDAEQYQNLLRDAQPNAIIYWQYTEDYGLVHVKADKTIEPTGRFYLMKQFATLTPTKSEVVTSTSDQPDVLISAFEKGAAFTVHIVNRGADREANLTGLPAGPWRVITTTEEAGFQETRLTTTPTSLKLPARSMISLVK